MPWYVNTRVFLFFKPLKTMINNKPSQEQIKLVQSDLMTNAPLREISAKHNVSYDLVWYYRKKLVKAGVLERINKKSTKRRKTRTSRSYVKRTSVIKTTEPALTTSSKTFYLVVNGSNINISGAKQIDVSQEKVEVKF